jgi:hypothetical protein
VSDATDPEVAKLGAGLNQAYAAEDHRPHFPCSSAFSIVYKTIAALRGIGVLDKIVVTNVCFLDGIISTGNLTL